MAESGPTVVWRADISGGYSGPAVAGDRVFITDYVTEGEITGDRRANSGTAFMVKNGARYFLFSESGDLIIARLTPEGYDEISRAHVLEPTGHAFGRAVVWSHPAFASQCMFARNDKELICVSLAVTR